MRTSITSLHDPLKPAAKTCRARAFTLLETMIGMSIFVIAGLGVIEVMGLMNANATADRALTAARLLVGGKISKVQTDPWTPSNKVVPQGCQAPTSGTLANQDSADIFDNLPALTSNLVTVIPGPTVAAPLISGTMNQSVSAFEGASGTLLVTYQLTFTFRSKTYTVSQSTIRAPDQL